ncbi:hypothetical protein FA15DRAFT_760705 [Coprinopsis marcescibilis]|uniref:3'-5' exonuclease domain-containing protein n=1 Tax=Coprinopsis marcescibilis TaxID=230819 RepID=A0A5C3KET5_COPMA|nr:hypothetical protein FA15DRAFT_760705 [Coprinopsis marcescibilis]
MAPSVARVADTLESVALCIADLTKSGDDTSTAPSNPPISPNHQSSTPNVAVDIEGIRLNRSGKVCIVQLKSNLSDIIWLLDVTTLGASAFNQTDAHGTSIRHILENPRVKKIFFDVRNDADALYNQYGVDMVNVCDLQILELAVRRSNKRHSKMLTGLGKCLESYLTMGPEWVQTKDEGRRLFAPELGGSYDVFENRPLDPRLVRYCAHDVLLLDDLEISLRRNFGRYGTNWNARVIAASNSRVQEAKLSFVLTGRERAYSPKI